MRALHLRISLHLEKGESRMSIEASDEGAVRRRRERTMELAAMFKEEMKGSAKALGVIIAKFQMQEGVRKSTALDYYNCLCNAGLVKISRGNKSWHYEPKAEWDLFKVEI